MSRSPTRDAPQLRFDADAKQQPGKWRARRELAQLLRRALVPFFERDLPEAELRALVGPIERWIEQAGAHRKLAYALFRDENVMAGDVMAYFDKSPIVGLASPLAAPLIPRQHADGRVEARATFGIAHEGMPGVVHGGIVASVFDEVLSFTQPQTGQAGMTASLTIRYLAPTPLHEELVFEAEIDRTEGRKIFARGRCRAGERITAEAEALFIRIRDEQRAAIDERRGRTELD